MEVIGVGLANIDLVAYVSDEFLARHRIPKAHTKKIDVLSFARLRAELERFDAIPGGCAANTLCGMGAYGVHTRFFGKIGEDSFESLYRASFTEYTVEYDVAASAQESSQCAVLITPDGERSFAFIHGASFDLSPEDIPDDQLKRAELIYAENYLFEFSKNADTAKKIFEAAQANKTPLVMKGVDYDFGKSYTQKTKALADAGILSLLVGNHQNLPFMVGAKNLDDAITAFSDWKCDVLITAITQGAYHISKGEVHHHPVSKVIENPKNTTGAGDQFVAGFLMGQLDKKSIPECMAFAENCALGILNHDTARPPLVNRHSIRF